MQSHIADDLWAIDFLSNKVMINCMAVIHIKSLYYVR